MELSDEPLRYEIRARDVPDALVPMSPDSPLARRWSPMPTYVVQEWVEYTVIVPGATHLHVESAEIAAEHATDGVFRVQFQNQLGRATLRAYAGERLIGRPHHLEVVARKFVTPEESADFLDALLSDLFARAAHLPFRVIAPTGRLVRETRVPPNPLFAYHFFRHHGRDLVRAMQVIAHRPVRRLDDRVEIVDLDQVTELDHDALLSILHGATHDDRAATTIARRLRPERIRQRRPIETIDTPENRFVLMVTRRLHAALGEVRQASWFLANAPERDQRAFTELHGELKTFLQDRQFAEVGEMEQLPTASRVLQRRDGYREVTSLWQTFQRARQPLFDRLEQVIDLRDVATLYEYWAFFELADRIASVIGVRGVLRTVPGELFGLGQRSVVELPGRGTLTYNASSRAYSGVTLRPDYVWVSTAGDRVAFDAKFRVSRMWLANEDGVEEDVRYRETVPDLVKMHAYRDAVGVRAAIVIYPGTESSMRMPGGVRVEGIDLERILGDLEVTGVGALAMSPVTGEG